MMKCLMCEFSKDTIINIKQKTKKKKEILILLKGCAPLEQSALNDKVLNRECLLLQHVVMKECDK